MNNDRDLQQVARAAQVRGMRMASALALFLLVCACRSSQAATRRQSELAIRETLDRLYQAFDFAAGGEPDWQTMADLFLEGAAFVAPVTPGKSPKGVSSSEFLRDFSQWVRTGEYSTSGLHERILFVRVDAFGSVAHAWVSFEGYQPATGTVRTRGLDSLQLVLDGKRWKVASFSTQYADEQGPLPARFLR